MLHQKSYVIDPNPHDLPPQSGKNKKQNKRDISQANINFVDPLFGQPLLPEAVSPTLLAATQSYFDIDQPLPQVNLDQVSFFINLVLLCFCFFVYRFLTYWKTLRRKFFYN